MIEASDLPELAAQAVDIGARNGKMPADGPQPGQAPRFRILHADELDTLPPVTYLDPEKEIPAHSFALVYGGSGVGKTFYTYHKAAILSQNATVVYVVAEGAMGIAARKIAWCKHHQKGPGQLYFVGQAVNLLYPAEVATFIDLARPLQPALIVVDTLARCMAGGDENSAKDMGLFVAGCDMIRQDLGATVLVVHHTGKNGLGERGSSALRAAADQMIELTNDDGLITVTCTKAKDAREFDARTLRLLPVETGRPGPDGEPETSCVVVPSDKIIMRGVLTEKGRALLETLGLEIFRITGARYNALLAQSSLSPSTFSRVLSKLVVDGYVRQDAKGDPYYPTEKGLAALTTTTTNSLPR